MKMRELSAISALIAILVSMSLSAHAEDAKNLYAKGVSAFEASNFDEAAAQFKAAYAAKPSWKLLFNIGQSLAAAKQYGGALEAFESYLAEGGDDVPEDRAAEVMREVERLRKLVGYVKIVAASGADIEVDGEMRGQAPISKEIPLSIGVEHTVVMIEGENRTEKKVTVRVGATTEVSFGVDEVPASADDKATDQTQQPEPVTAAPVKEDEGARKLKVAGWVTAGTGAAILIAAGVTGGLALSLDKSLAAECDNDTCTGTDWKEAEKMKNMGIATDIMFGVGGAALVTGVVLVIVGTKKGRSSESAISVSPVMSASFSGAVLKGAF